MPSTCMPLFLIIYCAGYREFAIYCATRSHYTNKPSSQLTNRGDFLYTQSRKCRSVLGDGNCLFRAVSHQLYGSEDQHLQIRHSLCNFIEQNQSKYEPYWIELTTSFSSHLKDIKKAGCWGTGLEIKACSDYLLTPVFNLNCQSSHFPIHCGPHRNSSLLF